MAFILAMSVSAKAEMLDVKMKQGFITGWDAFKIENLTTVEVIKTRPIEGWGKWNVLVDGWSIDFGGAWDANDQFNTGVMMLGRNLGTLGDYLPIDFPLKDKIKITLYPIGLYATDLSTGDARFSGASGVGVIEFNIKF